MRLESESLVQLIFRPILPESAVSVNSPRLRVDSPYPCGVRILNP